MAMQKSFIDRIFPQPKRQLLPQYNVPDDSSVTFDELPPRIELQDASPPASPQSTRSSTSRSLKPAPLSASLLHHDDPFLPIERAARTLQNNIQSFLDRQADALKDRQSGVGPEDSISAGSRTPTQSLVSPSRSVKGSATIPVRQPRTKPITLRGARKGLLESMQEFVVLREEELRLINAESEARQRALQNVKDLEDQREAVQSQIQTMQDNASLTNAATLRGEARNVQNEITELEHRLLELKVRHGHLINQAEQLESSAESELSSYRGTLAEIDKDAKRFLRRPPISHSLASRTGIDSDTNMYLLKSERRTLGMAKDQWTTERARLEGHKHEVEAEKEAFTRGSQVWQEAVSRITSFERMLRSQLKSMSTSHMLDRQSDLPNQDQIGSGSEMSSSVNAGHELQRELNNTISFLETSFSDAEDHNWNILVCALGAELEAFRQARQLLNPQNKISSPIRSVSASNQMANSKFDVALQDDFGPGRASDLLAEEHDGNVGMSSTQSPGINSGALLRRDSATSNESLKATLKEFPQALATNGRHGSSSASISRSWRNTDMRSESEDDDPGPDFLLSH